MKKNKNAFSRISLLLLSTIAISLITVGILFFEGEKNGSEMEVLISRGASASSIVETLRKAEVIRNPLTMKLGLRLSGGSHKIRAGEFRFRKNMRVFDAILTLYYSEPILHTIVIPEGWSARQIVRAISALRLGEEKKLLDFVFSSQLKQKFNIQSPSLEGYLFPDTYQFSRVDGEERIIESLVKQFFKKFDASLQEECRSKGIKIEDLVTLASIIEKETGTPEERETISSVFHNRLQKQMKLQSDPTTIYGIENFNGNLTKADLLRSTPYNTYTINGLPPGAIASPGLSALIAALRPAKTKYLYFVSNNQGGHVFSESYAEHSRYVEKYQKKKNSRKPQSILWKKKRKKKEYS